MYETGEENLKDVLEIFKVIADRILKFRSKLQRNHRIINYDRIKTDSWVVHARIFPSIKIGREIPAELQANSGIIESFFKRVPVDMSKEISK